MTCCPAHNTTTVCPQRHTCQLYRNYLETSGVVALVSMPISAGDGCYMYELASAGIREAARISEVTKNDSM